MLTRACYASLNQETEEPPVKIRPRQFALAAVVALLAIIVASCDETTNSQRSQVISLINKERSSRKLPRLVQAGDLNSKAGGWAAKMRNECRLSHSKLSDGVTLSWRALGENVAYASSIPKTHTSLMNSSRHRANILKSNYNRVGVGVATGKCGGYNVVYVPQVFADAR